MANVQEAACRTYVFYDEMADAHDDVMIEGGQDVLNRGVAKRDGNEIESWLHRFSSL